MPVLRPLPPRPSLELEHKQAKAFLRRLRAGDPESLARARARHPALDSSAPARIKLADAQLVLAREYGFASWPKLVRWFGDAERQMRQSHARWYVRWARFQCEAQLRRWRAELGDPRTGVWRAVAAYVPRFYGLRADEVSAEAVTDDELRLCVARHHNAPSWDALMARADEYARTRPDEWEPSPRERAGRAIAAADLDALRRVTEAHPELLRETADEPMSHGLLTLALRAEQQPQGDASRTRAVVDWLAAHGLDLRRTLNAHLCGSHRFMQVDEVRWLLDRGAEPNWVAPNGVPVLEHALIRYYNGAAVDLVAERTAPRQALWIAAGLGDVAGVARFLDRRGRPTPAARRLRPQFDVAGPRSYMPQLPDPDDEELLMEAFLVAVLNGRTAVLEYMASRGFPVDSLVYGSPIINVAVGNAWTPVVECLVRLGANLDHPGSNRNQTARQVARSMLETMPHDARRRRVAELCGLNPDAVLAERDARPSEPPEMHQLLPRVLDLASRDAARLGQSDVRPENLLFGLAGMRAVSISYFRSSGMDIDQFRADVRERARLARDRADGGALPLHPDAEATVQAAIAAATERRQALLHGSHLLYALTRSGEGAVAEVLASYGANVAALSAEVGRQL